MNVPLLGMQDSDWLLCAYIDGTDLSYVVVKRQSEPELAWIYYLPVDEQLPVLFDVFDVPAANPHFPWGLPVLPD